MEASRKTPSDVKWRALPKRRRRDRGSAASAERDGGDGEGAATGAEEALPESMEAKAAAGVERRLAKARAVATLEGRDGTRGEFYEYLDHSADVQIHAWGPDLKAAFENVVPAMFNYALDLSTVEEDPQEAVEFEVTGADLQNLLYQLLHEFLFRFTTDYFVCKRCEILALDREAGKITLRGHGEIFDSSKHPVGTEIKAITYSAMRITEEADKSELWVIVDI
mmetsp:Transcript_7641/g.25884  ORF Transcript_7641/g.25884 Transcript_7641/m.25884 type:complete len:223 (-) Transcript_7641:77-745(-)